MILQLHHAVTHLLTHVLHGIMHPSATRPSNNNYNNNNDDINNPNIVLHAHLSPLIQYYMPSHSTTCPNTVLHALT